MSRPDPTQAPIGTVWLAIICETGEEHLAPNPLPAIKVTPTEWHAADPTEHDWYWCPDYMVHHHTTLHTPGATA